MVPLTDNIVFGRKIAFLCEMAAGVGSLLPEHEANCRPSAPRTAPSPARGSEAPWRLHGNWAQQGRARPVNAALLFSLIGAATQKPEQLQERRMPEAHRCARSVKACKHPRAQCQLVCGGKREASTKSCFPPPRYQCIRNRAAVLL